MVRYLTACLLFFFCLLPSLAVADYERGHDRAEVVRIASHLIGQWENGPLYLGEDMDSGIHYPLNYPNVINGCNIGFGIHLGSLTQAKLDHWFARVIDPERIEELRPFVGVLGEEAFAMCGPDILVPPVKISRDEAISLMILYVVDAYYRVHNRLALEEANGLNTCQVAVMVALEYQNEVLFSEARNVPEMLAEHDFSGVYWEILYNSGSQRIPELAARRRMEARFFKMAYSGRCNPESKMFMDETFDHIASRRARQAQV